MDAVISICWLTALVFEARVLRDDAQENGEVISQRFVKLYW
jgi:hypothetical protein